MSDTCRNPTFGLFTIQQSATLQIPFTSLLSKGINGFVWSSVLTQLYKMPWHTSHCKTKTTSTVDSHARTNHHTTTPPQPFYGPFPEPPGWAGARRELLDFMVQGKINRGRHTDIPAGRHYTRTNQCPPPQTSQHKCSSSNLFADNVNTPKLTRPLRSVFSGWGTGLNWNTNSIGISTLQAQDGHRTGQEHTSLNRLHQSSWWIFKKIHRLIEHNELF